MKTIKTHKKNLSITFRNRKLSNNSILTYSNAINKYIDYLKDKNQKVNQESIIEFLQIIENEKKASTFNIYRQSLKEWLSEIHKNDHAQLFAITELFKTISRVQIKNSVLKKDYLSKAEIDSITKSLFYQNTNGSIRIALIIQLLFWTGLRITELINIRLTDIKISDNISINIVGKRKRTHTVYIQKSLFDYILDTFSGKMFLIETNNFSRYNRINISKSLKRYLLKLGFDISPHKLRHSKAMFLKNDRKLSPDQIQKALNHVSVKTTIENYFHGEPTPKDMGIDDFPFTIF